MSNPATPSSRNATPVQLLAAARARTVNVVDKLYKAMRMMESEIEQGDGLYPYNGGRITQSEVCRRAGVSKVTLQGAQHKTTTKCEVDKWVLRVRSGLITGKRVVRRTVTGRAETWKAAHAEIADKYHIDHLRLIDVQRRVRVLEEENAALRLELERSRSSKVSFLKPRGD